jgi:hypothetical protein
MQSNIGNLERHRTRLDSNDSISRCTAGHRLVHAYRGDNDYGGQPETAHRRRALGSRSQVNSRDLDRPYHEWDAAKERIINQSSFKSEPAAGVGADGHRRR